MAELGEGSEALHAQIGERARQTGVTALWTVGRLSQHASRAFGEGARHFSDQAALIEGLQQRSEEHTSELQSLMRISYAVFCLKKNKQETTLPIEIEVQA